MFIEETYIVITRVGNREVGAGLYEMMKFIMSNNYAEVIENNELSGHRMTELSDFVIGYEIKPMSEYVFELYSVDLPHSVVFEITDWCEENLKVYKRLIGTVIKSRIGMQRNFPIFEMDDEADAMAFKLRWM